MMGFTDVNELAGTHEDDVREFFPSPVHRAAFLQFVQYAKSTRKVKRKREEQVLEVLGTPGAAASSGSPDMPPARLAHRPASAVILAAQVKDIDAVKLQTSISKVLEK